MSVIIVAACAFYLFTRIFRRKESRKAHQKTYHLHPKQEDKARRLARAVRDDARPDPSTGDLGYDYRGQSRSGRRGFDIDLASAIWSDSE